MTAKNKANELVRKMYVGFVHDLYRYKAKQCALIAVENEYNSLREQLFNFKATGILTNEKVYLHRLNELIEEEKQLKEEINKL